MIPTGIIQQIADKIAGQYSLLTSPVIEIQTSESPEYFPLITESDDYGFESIMNPFLKNDVWTTAPVVKASPLSSVVWGLMTYFNSNPNYWSIEYPGSLDQYLYINGMTVKKGFADTVSDVTGFKMSGAVVENTDVMVFARFGKTEGGIPFFTSVSSYQTDNVNLPYGTYDSYVFFAPTDKVDAYVETGSINFDIHLICKDQNGDTFVHQQTLTGTAGTKISLQLSEKIVGFSGMTTLYNGSDGDLIRIQTAPEV
ncbi:MAG: hypothetical protein WCR96_02010 [Candidatus Methanomethylophilaceae archaeon]